MITFTIPGKPLGWQRTGTNSGRHFTKPQTRSYQSAIAWSGKEAMAGQPPFEGPVQITIEAIFPKPVSWSKKRAAATEWYTSKSDWDNIGKNVGDALNGICYRDDAQICHATVSKIYSNDGSARLTVTIEQLGADHEGIYTRRT